MCELNSNLWKTPDAVFKDLHEDSGVHTCDLRSPKSVLHQEYPWLIFENGFAEDDPLWTKDHRETGPEHDIRSRRALDKFIIAEGTCTYPTYYKLLVN